MFCFLFFRFSDLFYFLRCIIFILFFCIPISLCPCFSFFFPSLSGKYCGALVDTLVDGDGHHSAWNSGLCLGRLPPLSHHHLLQGHQEVGCHFFSVLFLLSVKLLRVMTNWNRNCHSWNTLHIVWNLTHVEAELSLLPLSGSDEGDWDDPVITLLGRAEVRG